MCNSRLLVFISLTFLAFLNGCEKNSELISEMEMDIKVTDLEVVTDPSGFAPLTAEIKFNTDRNAYVRLRVVGQDGGDSDVIHDFLGIEKTFKLLVLGLYPDFNNQIELTFFDENSQTIGSDTVSIQTKALIADMPQIEVNMLNLAANIDDFYFVNYFGYKENLFPQRAFLFDKFGKIRWYLDYSEHPILFDLFFDFGMVRLQNGNLIFGDRHTSALYEINMFGEIQNTWSLDGYGFHHTVIEKPNGNFLVTVNDYSKPTVEDVILEIDRTTGDIANLWDLNGSLDNSRKAWETNIGGLDVDWFHANGLQYSSFDNSIIVSGRTQGVVKLTENNEVIWILAPHKDWETSGNGTDLNQFLLQPLDAQGLPIEDLQILEGETNHPEFEWAWYQHSPLLLPNRNLMVFDNGDNRNYTGNGPYSRAVEYEIDEKNKTIRQVWDYGKERGPETYSRIVSKVEYLNDNSNVIFAPGAVDFDGSKYGKVIELDQNEQIIFEATITPPKTFGIITFHNVQRMPLYAK